MRDSINKYHLLIYKDNAELSYNTFDEFNEMFNEYSNAVGLAQQDIEEEYTECFHEMKRFGSFYCETYNSGASTVTAFTIDITVFDLYEVFNKELTESIKHLEHNKIHIDLFKRVNRIKSLQSLLDG